VGGAFSIVRVLICHLEDVSKVLLTQSINPLSFSPRGKSSTAGDVSKDLLILSFEV
jgi:hypothetical protein